MPKMRKWHILKPNIILFGKITVRALNNRIVRNLDKVHLKKRPIIPIHTYRILGESYV